jgi:hypothetical protein
MEKIEKQVPGHSKGGRREFLRDGFLLTGTVIFGLRQVIAEARQAGKPPFTAASLNQWLARLSENEYRIACLEAQRDLKAFVRKNFYLTLAQDGVLARLTPQLQQKFVAIINQTLEQGSRFKLVVHYLTAKEYAQERSGASAKDVSNFVAVRSQEEEVQLLQRQGKHSEAEKAAKDEKGSATARKWVENLIGKD